MAVQEAKPPGHRVLGRVTAQCTRHQPKGAFDALPLGTLQCGSASLKQMIAEKALEVGAELLVQRRCYRRTLEGSADPSDELFICWADATTALLDQPDSRRLARVSCGVSETDLSTITVGFVPIEPARSREVPWPEVTEVPEISVADRFIGDLTVSCETPCSAGSLGIGVERAARCLGAAHFTSPSCARVRVGASVRDQCHSRLSVPRVDPRVEPGAR